MVPASRAFGPLRRSSLSQGGGGAWQEICTGNPRPAGRPGVPL